jgi:hypothetical protein
MFPLMETALAFVAAMLAASLFVSALVQVLQGVGRYRARTVSELLHSLIHGFRVYHNDADILAAEAAPTPAEKRKALADANKCEDVFVKDILVDPVLHQRGEEIQYQDEPQQLCRMVEYIDEGDLIRLGRNYAEYYELLRKQGNPPGVAPPPAAPASAAPPVAAAVAAAPPPPAAPQGPPLAVLPLPLVWVGGASHADKPYADTQKFGEYVTQWFTTLEGTAAESFKKRIRRLTLVIACSVVVLFNLDGIDLVRGLFANGNARAALGAQAGTLQDTADRLRIAGFDGGAQSQALSNHDLALVMQKTATILDEVNIGIGWQNSWITRRWAAYKGVSAIPGLPPTRVRLVLDTLSWVLGLFFSAAMVSLGSRFWLSMLAKVLPLKNEVQYRKQEEAAK